MNQVTDTVF